jgi:hypothetical protein
MAHETLRGECGGVKAWRQQGRHKGLAELYGRWHVSPGFARLPPP